MSTTSSTTQDTQDRTTTRSMPTKKRRHPQHRRSTSQTHNPHQTPPAANASTEHSSLPAPTVPADPIMHLSTSHTSYQQQEAIAGPSSAPAAASSSKALLDTSRLHAQPPTRKVHKPAGGKRSNTHNSSLMTPAQRAVFLSRYTYADMRDMSSPTAGPLLLKIPSPYETGVIFHDPNAPGVDYTLFRMTTHDFLDFDAVFALYPTYCLLPAAMKPSRADWEITRTAENNEGRKVRCVFCRARFGGRNAKAMWERHAKEHWEKGARASWEKETKTTAPRNMSARTLAQSRGHLPAAPERLANVAARGPSVRAAAVLASTHFAASEAGPSSGQSQALHLRSGSPIRVTAEPPVRPPLYILPRLTAWRLGESNFVELSKKEQAAQDRYNSLSDSDSDVESVYTDEDDIPSSSQSTSSVSVQAGCEPVLRNYPRNRFSPCTPPPPDAAPLEVRTTPISYPGDLVHSPNILIPFDHTYSPIWTAADDEKLRTGEYDPDSPTNLLQRLEQSIVTDLPIGKKALLCADGDGEGPLLHAGASNYKRSRGEEEDDEELQRMWNSYKRAKMDAASPFDLKFGDEDGFKLGDFALAAMEPFDFGIKPAGPLLASPFAENEGLCGSWVNDPFTALSFDLSIPATDPATDPTTD